MVGSSHPQEAPLRQPSLYLSPQRGRACQSLSLWERDWVRVAALRRTRRLSRTAARWLFFSNLKFFILDIQVGAAIWLGCNRPGRSRTWDAGRRGWWGTG